MIARNSLDTSIADIKARLAELNAKDNLMADENQQALRDVANDMIELFIKAREEGQLRALLHDLVSDTKSWLLTVQTWAGKDNILLPVLSECACTNSDKFNRCLNHRRDNVESSIMSFINERFPDPKSATINYMAFGGGKLLQDFILLSKMILAGYANINVHLVDPGHQTYSIIGENYGVTRNRYLSIVDGKDVQYKTDDISVEKSDALISFSFIEDCANEVGVKLTIADYASIDEYKKATNVKPDVITAIDLDDFYSSAFDDTMKAHQTLDEHGRMFLSEGSNDFILTKDRLISEWNPNTGEEAKDLIVRDRNILNIAQLTAYNTTGLIENIIIPYIRKHKELQEVNLTLAHPQELAFFGAPKGKKFPRENMSSECLGYFIKLLTALDIKINVKYITGNKSMEKILPQVTSNQDLVIYFGKTNMKGKVGIKADMQSIRDKFPTSIQICGMHAKDRGDRLHHAVDVFSAEWIWDGESKVLNIADAMDDASKDLVNECYANQVEAKHSMVCK